MKTKRGGKREGSGAKLKYGEHTEQIGFKVPISKIEEFKIYCRTKLKTYER